MTASPMCPPIGLEARSLLAPTKFEIVNPAPKFDLSHEQIQHLVTAHGDVFRAFAGVTRPIFVAMLEGETAFARRPNVSLRFLSQDALEFA